MTIRFKHVSPQLKSCRLVCQFWNEIILSIPNLGLRLDQKRKSVENDPDKFFVLISTFDSRLMKRIFASCDNPSFDVETSSLESFGLKLTQISSKFSNIIQILNISIITNTCLNPVYTALTNSFPNLKELRVDLRSTVWIWTSRGSATPRQEEIKFLPLPQKPTLTLVAFRDLPRHKLAPSPPLFAQLVQPTPRQA